MPAEVSDPLKSPELSEFRRAELGKTVVLRRNRSFSSSLCETIPSRPPTPKTLNLTSKNVPSRVLRNDSNTVASGTAKLPVVAGKPSLSTQPAPFKLRQGASQQKAMSKLLAGVEDMEPFNLNVTRDKTLTTDQAFRRSGSSAPLKPIALRGSMSDTNFNHVRKSTDRINMSFDNTRYWEIEKTNRFLAERIQKTKPTYSRTPSETRMVRSRFDLKQSKDFFTFERENTRLANRIVLARPTVPGGRPQSAASSRPGSAASTFRSVASLSRASSTADLQRRPEWDSRW